MGKKSCFVVLFLILLASWGCGTTKSNVKADENHFVLKPGTKIKVEDVVNVTGQVSSVDTIGLLWSSLENALKEEDLLWTQNSGTAPLKLEAQIVKYKKGHALQRWVMPGFGSTVLHARVDLKNGSEIVGSFDAQHSVSLGDGLTTIGGWQKVFAMVAEDIVEKIKYNAGG